MESVALASFRLPSSAGTNPTNGRQRVRRPSTLLFPLSDQGGVAALRRGRFFVSAVGSGGSGDHASLDNQSREVSSLVATKLKMFASFTSSNNKDVVSTVSTGTGSTLTAPPVSPYIGGPLFWVGVGVAISALFTAVAKRVQNYAMQQAFKTMMKQTASPSDQFGKSAFPPGSPFSFPIPTETTTSNFSPFLNQNASQTTDTVDVPATKVEATPVPEIADETKTREPSKKYSFVDISPEELEQKDLEYSRDKSNANSDAVEYVRKDPANGASFTHQEATTSANTSQDSKSGTSTPAMSVDVLEKMMEDPTVQKMVYPYLPEAMRNPETFKWMLQNPQYREQLQSMLNSMGGGPEWDNRMMESLKNFDLNSPEVKQQFQQIGLTPEEVISRIMANPDIAVAFQNPRIQAAIMDCSQNPLNISKYQNDKEIMDVFSKISELFPGVTS